MRNKLFLLIAIFAIALAFSACGSSKAPEKASKFTNNNSNTGDDTATDDDITTDDDSSPSCEGGCLIGGVCYGNDAMNPQESCQRCIPDKSVFTWSPVADTTFCDDGLYCNGADSCLSGACVAHTGDPCIDNGLFCDEGTDQCNEPATTTTTTTTTTVPTTTSTTSSTTTTTTVTTTTSTTTTTVEADDDTADDTTDLDVVYYTPDDDFGSVFVHGPTAYDWKGIVFWGDPQGGYPDYLGSGFYTSGMHLREFVLDGLFPLDDQRGFFSFINDINIPFPDQRVVQPSEPGIECSSADEDGMCVEEDSVRHYCSDQGSERYYPDLSGNDSDFDPNCDNGWGLEVMYCSVAVSYEVTHLGSTPVVEFTNRTFCPPGVPATANWSFGNGAGSQFWSPPPQIFNGPGVYQGSLEVCNNFGCGVFDFQVNIPGAPQCGPSGPYCPDDGLFCDGATTCISGLCHVWGNPCFPNFICNENTDHCDSVDECSPTDPCSDDGLYCNGTETCLGGICGHSGNPCGANEVCNEQNNSCAPTNCAVTRTGTGRNGGTLSITGIPAGYLSQFAFGCLNAPYCGDVGFYTPAYDIGTNKYSLAIPLQGGVYPDWANATRTATGQWIDFSNCTVSGDISKVHQGLPDQYLDLTP